MSDDLVFEKAVIENRFLLTFDLDFGEIIALSAGKSVSVILFRLHDTRTSHIINRLRQVLVNSEADLEEGAIIIVEESRHRVRRLPFS